MKKLLTLLFLIGFSANIFAQNAPSTFTLTLNQDNAFGFAPAAFGSLGLNKDLSLTYYGIFWTNSAYTNNGGLNSWLETGIGLGFPALDGKAYINPSLGFTHGSLLSNNGSGQVAEGIVPNLAIFYTGEYTELEIYAGYYKALDRSNAYSDFLLYWAYPGLRLTESISAGIHYEQFYLTDDVAGNSESFYQWFGGYLKFVANGKYSFRFSAGNNMTDNSAYANSFYKLALTVPLL